MHAFARSACGLGEFSWSDMVAWNEGEADFGFFIKVLRTLEWDS
jgi:hypothetical protein